MENKEFKLLTTEQAAEELGITYDGLSRAVLCKRIRPITKIGRRIYFDAAEIAAYKAKREARYARV